MLILAIKGVRYERATRDLDGQIQETRYYV